MTHRWLITGATGQLGGHVVKHIRTTLAGKVEDWSLDRPGGSARDSARSAAADLACAADLQSAVSSVRPTHVIHLAALTSVADAFSEPARAELLNVAATRALAEAAAIVGARLVYCSTDMVFGGDRAPYREADPPAPLSVYGRSKAAAERLVADFANTLIVRPPLLFGLPIGPRHSTFAQQLAALQSGTPLKLFTDEFRTPLWLGDAARAIAGLAGGDRTGLIHLAGPERLSRFDLIRRVAECLGIRNPRLEAISRYDFPASEPRPADLSLCAACLHAEFPQLAARPMCAEMFAPSTPT